MILYFAAKEIGRVSVLVREALKQLAAEQAGGTRGAPLRASLHDSVLRGRVENHDDSPQYHRAVVQL